jgi:rubrerythrin
MEKFNILEAIDIAMEAESKARDFYRSAAEKVSNERGKNLLKQLADFEKNHFDRLSELKKSLQGESGFIKYSGTAFEHFSAGSVSEVSGKLEENKSDVLDILGIAIDAEDKAYHRYLEMARNIDDPKGRDMFHQFAEEEKAHRRILSDEFYYMSNKGGLWFWGD